MLTYCWWSFATNVVVFLVNELFSFLVFVGNVAVYALWCATRSSKCYNGYNNSDHSALQHISESSASS